MSFDPQTIRIEDSTGKLERAGFSWSNPTANETRRNISNGQWIGLLCLGIVLLFVYRGLEHNPGRGFILLLSLLIIGSALLMFLLRSRSEETRTEVIFERDKAEVLRLDGSTFTVPDITAISSIEITPDMNRAGSQFMMPDPDHSGQVYPSFSVAVFHSGGGTLTVGQNLRQQDARIVVVQLNEALTLMRPKTIGGQSNHFPGSETVIAVGPAISTFLQRFS